MAARVLLQRHAAPLTASLVAGSMMLYPRAAFAEAPDSYTPTKKPIYDDLDAVPTTATLPPPKPSKAAASPSSSSTTVVPENPASPSLQEVVVHSQQARGPTPTDRLALQIRDARLFLYRHACNAEDALNRAMDRAFNLERSFTDTVAGLAPRAETGEKLMPGLVYVLVAAMAGSMVTRRSNILLRATVPVAFGVGMGWTVLPVTMANVSELAWRYEQRFPAVAQGHIKTREALASSVKFAEAHRRVVVDAVDEKVKGARETVEDWVKKGK